MYTKLIAIPFKINIFQFIYVHMISTSPDILSFNAKLLYCLAYLV